MEKKLENWTFTDLLNKTASASPTPGGGSVSALVGALGSALVAMLGHLSVNKKQCPDQGAIERIIRESEAEMKAMLAEAEKDVEAYNAVMAAYGAPKNSEEEKTIRLHLIQEALKKATEVPLEAAGHCKKILLLAEEAAEKGNPNVISDAIAGGLLAEAALQSILLNVHVNLQLVHEEEWKKSLKEQMNLFSQEGMEIRSRLLGKMRGEE